MMRLLLLSFLLGIGLAAPSLSIAAQDGSDGPDATGLARARTIHLDVHASSWRSRGRVSFGIVPSLRMKLTSAGYAVTEDPQVPHDLTLTVDYREERGAPISINLSGTEITCVMALEHPRQGRLFTVKFHVAPRYAELASAPYVEVVERLQASPYFYFLGDLIRGRLDAQLNPAGALILALDRQFARDRQPRHETPLDTLESPAETFPDLDLFFAPLARENAVEELGRLKDPRAIELLERLTDHPDRRTRLRAVHALGEFDSLSIAPALTRVVQTDSDPGVRDAAAGVLTRYANP